MAEGTLWIRLTTSAGEDPTVAHAEVVRPGGKHRIAPLGPAGIGHVFSAAMARFLRQQVLDAASIQGVLAAPEQRGSIGGVRYRGKSVTSGARPLVRLRRLEGDLSSLFNPDVWAAYPKRHAITDIARDCLQTILLPSLNMAYALTHLPSFANVPALVQKTRALQERIDRFDRHFPDLQDFVAVEEAEMPPLLSASLPANRPGAPPDDGSRPKDEMVANVVHDPDGGWSVASVVCGAGQLMHKVIFNPPVRIERVFGSRIGHTLSARIDERKGDAQVLSDPEFLCCDSGFAALGLRVLVHWTQRPVPTGMVRLRRIYGVPAPLDDYGPWPVHAFPAPGPTPASLLDHCRSATDWARIVIGVAEHAGKVSPEFLGVVADRLGFEVDLVKRNLVTQGVLAA